MRGWQEKETPSKGHLSLRLLIQRSSNVNSASNSTAYHRVVTDSELIAFCDIICIPERCDGKMSMKVFHYQ